VDGRNGIIIGHSAIGTRAHNATANIVCITHDMVLMNTFIDLRRLWSTRHRAWREASSAPNYRLLDSRIDGTLTQRLSHAMELC